MEVHRRIAVLMLVLLAVAGTCAAAVDPGEQLFATATTHYTQGQAAQAFEEFQQFLVGYGNHAKAPLARFYAGEALVQLRRYAEAVEQFRPLAEQSDDPRLARKSLFRAGESSCFAGQWDDACKLLGQFVERYRGDKLNAYALVYLGDAACQKNDDQAGEREYRKALADYPDGPLADDCRCGLARICQRQGKLDEARKLFALVIAKGGPAAATATSGLAELEASAGNAKQAATLYGEAAQHADSPETADRARLGQALALRKLNKLAEAKAALEPLVAGKGPHHVEASYWLARTQLDEQAYTQAATTLAGIAPAADDPLAPAIAFYAGQAWLHAGKSGEAVRMFEQVLSSWPKCEFADDALLGRARAALAEHDAAAVARAVEDLQRRFPASELNADATRLLARSHLTENRYAEATELLEPLVKTPPAKQDTGAQAADRYLLALAYQGRKRYADVLTTLEHLGNTSDGDVPRADRLRLQAAALVALKRFAEAIGPLESLITANPEPGVLHQAQAQLAVCFAETGKWAEARDAYQTLKKDAGDNDKLLLTTAEVLAEAALAAGQREWSDELFAFLASDGHPPEQAAKGLGGLAWSELRAGKLDEAAAHFEQLATRFPNDPLATAALLARGQIFEREKRFDEAVAAYHQVIKRQPQSDSAPQALLGAARAEELAGHLQAAVELYQRLLDEYPKADGRDIVLYNSAWALEQLGRHDEADARFEQLHQGNWRSRYWADAVYRLAERALEHGDRAKARAILAELIESQPGDQVLSHALYLQAQVSAAGEQWDEVRAPLVRLVEDFPDSPLANLSRFWLAEAAYRSGKYADAKDLFARLDSSLTGKREPWMAMIRLRRAQICVHERQWLDARHIAESIATDYPGFEQQYEVDYVLGRVLANDGRLDDAREAYSRVIRSQLGGKTETAAMAQWMIGETYFHQKNYEAAVREYLRLEVLYAFPTWQAGALLQAGKCHELLGQWSEATDAYARLLKNFPSTTFTDEAARRLSVARNKVSEK